jgi:hypothetical protein
LIEKIEKTVEPDQDGDVFFESTEYQAEELEVNIELPNAFYASKRSTFSFRN